MEWSDFISGVTDIGKAGGDIYNAWSSDGDEETAYLKGQIAGITQTQQQQTA